MLARARAFWIPTSDAAFRSSEQQLLASVRSPHVVSEVAIGSQQHIHTLEVSGSGGGHGADRPPLVLCHGFGLGIGAWAANYDALVRGFSRVFAIDWLGCGLSSRPAFGCRSREQAEAFFVDSLEQWRRAQGLDKMLLCGHSFGGYMAACYAMQHPDRVAHLVLVSPVGVPERPPSHAQPQWPLWVRAILAGVRFLWTLGVTPQGIVRAFGPWGPGLIEAYVQRRFPATVDKHWFAQYLYHNCAARGSGEHALGRVLAPGAFAHAPLEHRLHELKCPVSFIYGAHDWMDPAGAARARARIEQRFNRSKGDEGRAAFWPIDIMFVPGGGHQMFLDQPDAFAGALEQCVRHVEERAV